MILVADSSTLTLLVNPKSNPPIDPNTGNIVTHAAERVAGLVAGLAATDTLIIPAPALAEVLVHAGDAAPDMLAKLHDTARVRIEGFGERAAVETAAMIRDAKRAGDKKSGSSRPWQQVKIDRQIIAIARVSGADRIYSDDGELSAFARALGMDAVSTWELPVPPVQIGLFDTLAQGAPRAPETPPSLALIKSGRVAKAAEE